jgi:hypothetical protein
VPTAPPERRRGPGAHARTSPARRPAPTGARRRRGDWRGAWADVRRDVAGVGAVLAAIAAYLAPAWREGASFGTFDSVIPFTSLGAGLYNGPPHNPTDADVISQMETWNLFDWRQIHAGHFPLWNPFSLLGLPQFANFQSSVLSLPDLVSYALPARYAFVAAVIMKLVIAGTGAYVFARVVGLGALSSAFAGITYVLSGGFASELSWPLTDVLAWVGWLAAFAVLAYRWPSRPRYVVGLAVATAFSIYGGFPEANATTALFGVVAGAVIVVTLALQHRRLWLRGLARIGGGIVAGAGLAMPLVLPGVQYAANAHRQTEATFGPIPGKGLVLLLVPGYYGSPTLRGSFPMPGTNFYDTVAYVGIVVAILAVVAIVTLPRHPLVLGLAGGTLALVLASYGIGHFHPILDLLKSAGLATVVWRRARYIVGFPLGILAAIGLETLLRSRGHARAPWAFAAASAAALGGLAWLRAVTDAGATGAVRAIESRSLGWPTALAAGCTVAALVILLVQRMPRPRQRVATCGTIAGLIFAANVTSLVAAGAGLNTWTKGFYPESAAMKELSAKVGSGIVAIDDGRRQLQSLSALGYYPELNMAYRLDEFAGHDPLLPQSYFEALAPGQGVGGLGLLEPSVDSVLKAQEYGISWLLVPEGRGAPRGATFVESLAGQRLFHVPGSSRFSLASPSGAPLAANGDRILSVRQPFAGSYAITVRDTSSARLVARITNVVGWHASIDGRSVAIEAYDGVMQSLSVPPGSHAISFWYEPASIFEGAAVALLAALGLGSYALWSRRAARRGGTEALDDGFSVGDDLDARTFR